MGQSVLVFVSHSSNDKESFIEPIVQDLEDCYINVWLDKRKILPGDNLRKSIFKEGLDKADIALIFFTNESLKSSWVDKEIKHVLREESKKGNNFDLNKIISIFDSEETYTEISERYPELTDDFLHLMPTNYDKTQLGQLISAIWSKYLSLQGGDVETQRQLLEKDKEIFQKDKTIQDLNIKISNIANNSKESKNESEFSALWESGNLTDFVKNHRTILSSAYIDPESIGNLEQARAFGLVQPWPKALGKMEITSKGKEFFRWYYLNIKP